MASKILLADDSITIQKVVNLTFADEGIDVITVSNGEIAERRLSEISPDLVLADIFMPGKNGYELCQFIKDTPPFQNIPVVLLVGAFEPFDQSEARRVRADGHLTKPFESRTLVETVRKLIQTSRSKGGAARQAQAKPQQVIRDTRPLAPEAEQHHDQFIDVSQVAGDTAEQSGQNGAPTSTAGHEPPASAVSAGAEPVGIDYHGLWEMGTAADKGVQSPGGGGAEISFGLNIGTGDTTPEGQAGALFASGFEISAPQTTAPDAQPAPGTFEFGFSETLEPARPESAGSQVAHPDEALQVSVPSDSNGASEQVTGFAVPSLFSGNGKDQVLDFKQVNAPEPPAPASEMAFDVSSAPVVVSPPVDTAEAIAESESAHGAEGKYFDLIAQESPAASTTPEAIHPSDEAARLAADGPFAESGFDLAGLAAEPGPIVADEEPLGDVFSPDKTASNSEETAFAISEEAVTVDVRVPAAESFRMVIPPSQEGEYSGAWPHLDADRGASVVPSLSEAGPLGSSPTSSSAAPLGTDVSGQTSSERSFAFSEASPAAPFDPMELRAGEPTEAPPAAQTEYYTEATPQFASTIRWREPEESPLPSHEAALASDPSGPVAALVSGSTDIAPAGEWPAVVEQNLTPKVEAPSEAVISAPAGLPEVVHAPMGPVDGAESEPVGSSPATSAGLAPEVVDDIVRRVVREMSDAVIRELAWEILPDCVERVVEKLSRESLAKKL